MKIETLKQLIEAKHRYRHFMKWVSPHVTARTIWQWERGGQHPNQRILKNVIKAVNDGIAAEEIDK